MTNDFYESPVTDEVIQDDDKTKPKQKPLDLTKFGTLVDDTQEKPKPAQTGLDLSKFGTVDDAGSDEPKEITDPNDIKPSTKQVRRGKKVVQVAMPLTPEQQAERERLAKEQYNTRLLESRKRAESNTATQEDRIFRNNHQVAVRKSVVENRNAQRQKLMESGKTPEEIEKILPSNPVEGLQGNPNDVKSLEGILDSRGVTPTSEKIGQYDIATGFTSNSLIDTRRLYGKTGEDLQNTAFQFHASNLGFDDVLSPMTEVAKNVLGVGNLFIRTDGDNKDVPISSLEELLDEGRFVHNPQTNTDLVDYQDSNGEVTMIGLVTRLAKGDVNKAIDYYKKFKKIEESDANEFNKDAEYYKQNLEVNKLGFGDSLYVALRNFFAPKGQAFAQSVDSETELAKQIMGDDAILQTGSPELSTVEARIGKPIDNRLADASMQSVMQQLNKLRNYRRDTRLNSLYQSVSRAENLDALRFISPVTAGFVENITPSGKKYLPSTAQLGTAGFQFGQGMIPYIGLPATLLDMHSNLMHENPTKYRNMMMVSALTMGAGRALNQLNTVIPQSAIAGSQLGLSVGQTTYNYNINGEAYKNPDGSINYGYLFQDLIVDLGGMGFDIGATVKAAKGLGSGDSLPYDAFNFVVKNTDNDKYMMFVQNKKSGLIESVVVSEADAQKWINTQSQNKKQYMLQQVDNTFFDDLVKLTGNRTVKERIKAIIGGDKSADDARINIDEQVRKNTVVDKKEKIVDGEVQVTETTRNPQMVFDETGNLVDAKSNATVGKRLTELPDDNRVFSTLRILDETQAPLNINSNLVGDERVLPTMRDLQSKGYITIDPNGNLKLTPDGEVYSRKLVKADESFDKLITKTQEEFGSDNSPKAMKDINELMAENQFWNKEKTEQTYSIQDIAKMGKKQKQALALKISLGEVEYNRDTGIASNTSFTRKLGDITYDFGKKGAENAKFMDLAKAINGERPVITKNLVKDIMESRGLEDTPENQKAIKDEALERFDRFKQFKEEDGVVKVDSFDLNEEVQVKDVPNSKESDSADIEKPVTTKSTVQNDDIQVEFSDGRRHTFIHDKDTNTWKDKHTGSVLPDKYLKNEIESGNAVLKGKTPKSWEIERQDAKDNYKLQNSAVKQSIVPREVSRKEARQYYKDEANVINLAVFGHTAEQWRDANPKFDRSVNVRDFADNNQLNVLKNLEKINEKMIAKGISQDERIITLNREARKQFKALENLKTKPIPSEKVDKPVKVKESKELTKIFKNADPAKIEQLQKAIRGGKTKQATKLVRELVGADADFKMFNDAYNKARNTVEATDLAMYNEAFANEVAKYLNIDNPKQMSIASYVTNMENWFSGEGLIKMINDFTLDIGKTIDGVKVWFDKNAKPYLEVSTDGKTVYLNNDAFKILRGVMNLPYENYAGFVNNNPDRLVKALKNSPFKDSPEFAPLISKLESFGNEDTAVSYLRLVPAEKPYDLFNRVETHESTHQVVLNNIGVRLFYDSQTLDNIMNHKDGQLIRMNLSDNYANKSTNDMAHEILAFATNPKDIKGFLKSDSPEVMDAFINTYYRLLNDISKTYGKDKAEIISKYADENIQNAIARLEENERSIKENELQSVGRGYEESRRVVTRGLSEDDADKIIWSGSGIKRVKARRLTPTGNPLDLTRVAGAEIARLKSAGAEPPINFFVETPDGTFKVEKPFKAEVFAPFDIEAEFNLADLHTDEVAKGLFEKYKDDYPTFQKELEKLGYDGLYNSNPDMADMFRYRMQLFRNDNNITKLQDSTFDMYSNSNFERRTLDLLNKDNRYHEWMGDNPHTRKILYHGTKTREIFENTSNFDPDITIGEFGTHIGTLPQASDFVVNLRRMYYQFEQYLEKFKGDTKRALVEFNSDLFNSFLEVEPKKDRIIPVITNIKNPLRVGDGQWFSHRLTDKLVTERLISPADIVEVFDSVNDKISTRVKLLIRDIYNSDNYNKHYSEIRDDLRLQDLANGLVSQYDNLGFDDSIKIERALLQKAGYDSLVYTNTVEGINKVYYTDLKDNETYSNIKFDDSYIIFDNKNLEFAMSPKFDMYKDGVTELASFDMMDAPEQSSDLVSITKKDPRKLTTDEVEDYVQRGTWSNISAIKDGDDSKIPNLKSDLQKYKLKYIETEGKYQGESEKSFLVLYDNPDSKKIVDLLGAKYNQESVLHADNGKYTIQMMDGKYTDSESINLAKNEDIDLSEDGTLLVLPDGNLRYNIDFDFNNLKSKEQSPLVPEEDSPFQTFDMFERKAKTKLYDSDENLKNADFDAWLNLASQSVSNGFLSEGEVKTIKRLSEAEDIDGLNSYVANLNKMGVIKLGVDFMRVGLITAVKSFTKNTAGNLAKTIMDEISKIPASVIDIGMSKLSEDRVRSLATNPIVTLKAIKDGLLDAGSLGLMSSLKTIQGKEASNFEHPTIARERTTGYTVLKPLETFVKYAWRLQGALDKPFATYAYRRTLSEIQQLKHQSELKAGNRITFAEAANLLTDADYDLAQYIAVNASFQGDNRIASAYYKAKENNLPPTLNAITDHVFKFVKTPLNVVDYTLDYTGFWQLGKLGYDKVMSQDYTNFKQAVKDVMNTPKDRKIISMAISQGVIGGLMTYIGYRMAENNMLNPMYDEKDGQEREQMGARNESYGSVNINGYNVDISWITPNSFYLLAGASMYNDGKKFYEKLTKAQDELAKLSAIEGADTTVAQEKVTKLLNSSPTVDVTTRIAKNLALQTPFIRQAYDLQDKGVSKFLADTFVTPENLIPKFVEEFAKTQDTKGRVLRTDTLLNNRVDKMKDKIPNVLGLIPEEYRRESLPVKSDMLGRDDENAYGVDPFRIIKIKNDAVSSELDRLNYSVTSQRTGNPIIDNKLKREKGQFITPYLEKAISTEEYQSVDDETKKSMLRNLTFNLFKMQKDGIEKEKIDHKSDLIIDMHKTISMIKNRDKSLQVTKITDKETIRDIIRAGIDVDSINLESMLNKYGRTDKDLQYVIRNMYNYHFENDKDSLEESKKKFEEFKKDKGARILSQFINKIDREESEKRLDKWRAEYKAQGLSDEDVESKVRGKSVKYGKSLGYKYRNTKEIVLPKGSSLADLAHAKEVTSQKYEQVGMPTEYPDSPDKWKGQRQSQNIIDSRPNSEYSYFKDIIFNGEDKEIQELSKKKEVLDLTESERQELIDFIDRVLKYDIDNMQKTTEKGLQELRKRIVLD